jgi:hypothetical protein
MSRYDYAIGDEVTFYEGTDDQIRGTVVAMDFYRSEPNVLHVACYDGEKRLAVWVESRECWSMGPVKENGGVR